MIALQQQVNLYQPAAEQQCGPLDARAFLLICGVTLTALMCVWGIGTWQVGRLSRDARRLERQQQQTEQTLNALGSADLSNANSSTMEARVHRLQVELVTSRRVLALLQAGTIGRTGGFSDELAALARRPVRGLWLQRVALSAVGDPMSLSGEVLDPDLVPRYLHALATQPALSGVHFERLVIRLARPRRSGPGSAVPRFTFQVAGSAAPIGPGSSAGPQT